jgi:1-acyl-sn-glycerol-3-phosphate acyltransferase
MGRLNYFSANKFMDIPILGYWLVTLGCFPAKPHDRHPYGVDHAMSRLRLGESVLIFPQGKRTADRESRVYRGIEELAHHPSVMIVPAHIEWRRTGWWRSFSIGIDEPFDGGQLTADEIMTRIYSVPVSGK